MRKILWVVFLLFPCLAGADWSSQTDTGGPVYGLAAVSSTSVWAAGYHLSPYDARVYHFNGTTWSLQTDLGDERRLKDITAPDNSHVWTVAGFKSGDTYEPIYYYNGTSWTVQTTINDYYFETVDAANATNVWAAGSSISGSPNTIYYYNGSSWSAQTSLASSNPIYDLSALNPLNVWSVDRGGRIFYYNGSSWAVQTTTGSYDLRSISARDTTHVWATGADSSGAPILFYDGSSWSVQTVISTATALNQIYAAASGSAWAVGTNGHIYYFDGTSWSLQTDTTTGPLLYVDGAGVWVWSSSYGGTIYRDWDPRAVPEPSTFLLLALFLPFLPFGRKLSRSFSGR